MTLNEWIVLGDVGVSSRTMWAAITATVTSGTMGRGFDIPNDPADFSRCYKLWQKCALTPGQLGLVKVVFPWWSPYIDNWDKLVSMLERNDRGMYKYMCRLRDEARLLAGWKKTGEGSWRYSEPVEHECTNTNSYGMNEYREGCKQDCSECEYHQPINRQ
jgi:hypothetical protein